MGRGERGGRQGQASAPLPERGSLSNPLTAEELARLPTPAGGSGDNRPSSFQQATGSARQALPHNESKPQQQPTPVVSSADVVQVSTLGAPAPDPAAPGSAAFAVEVGSAASCSNRRLPVWLSGVDERRSADAFELLVQFSEAAGDTLGMQDLELDADPAACVLRLRLLGF